MPTPCIFCKQPAYVWIRVKKKGEETFSPARPICLTCGGRLSKNENYTIKPASPPAQKPPADEMKSPPPAHIPSARSLLKEIESNAAHQDAVPNEPFPNTTGATAVKNASLSPIGRKIVLILFLLTPFIIAFAINRCSQRSSPSPRSSYTPSYSYSSGSSSSTSPKEYIPSSLSDSTMANMWDDAKKKVKGDLKSPSTAKFPKFHEVSYVKGGETELKVGGFNYSIVGYVDSQNGFGATIRTRFIVFFNVSSSTSWKIVDVLYE